MFRYDVDGQPIVPDGPCDNPNLDQNTVQELCALPPDKGTGSDDLFRIYYNPIVQQCLPFSYSVRIITIFIAFF